MDYRYCPYCGTPPVTKMNKAQSRLYCPHCEKFLYRNPMAAVAGIVLNDSGAILLVQRAVGETYPGKWCIPCGHIEWGEDIRDALTREMAEETGLTVTVERIYEVESNFHQPAALSVGCWFICKVTGGDLQAADDAADARYFHYRDLPELAFPTDRIVLDKLFHQGLLA